MSEKRTVLVDGISYRGTDGEDHVAYRGEQITVAADGVAHFDWVHDATPEAEHARREATETAAQRAKVAQRTHVKADDKAAEKS